MLNSVLLLAICLHTWSELHHDPVLRLSSTMCRVSRPRTPCRHRVKISIITRLSLVPHHGHRSNTRMKIVFSIEEVNFCPSLAAGEMSGGVTEDIVIVSWVAGSVSWHWLLGTPPSSTFVHWVINTKYMTHKTIWQYNQHPFLYFSPGSGIKSSWNLRNL